MPAIFRTIAPSSVLAAWTVLVLAGTPASALSQNTAELAGATPAPAPGAPAASLGRLDISIVTSRSQVTAGSDMGVIGIVTNKGDSVAYISESSVVMALPPELVDPAYYVPTVEAWFPTEHGSSSSLKVQPNKVVMALQPGVSYPVHFRLGRRAPPKRDGASWFMPVRAWFEPFHFTPGKYQISVIAKSWSNDDLPPEERAYVTQSQSALVEVAAPQHVVMVGAALGGLIAYLLFPSRRRRSDEKVATTDDQGNWIYRSFRVTIRVQKALWSAVTAMIWSAVVTILLARLSETQFVIRVTVQDFWGAIALGFVAQYAGAKWLEKYDTSGGAGAPPESSGPAAPVGVAADAPGGGRAAAPVDAGANGAAAAPAGGAVGGAGARAPARPTGRRRIVARKAAVEQLRPAIVRTKKQVL